MLQENLIPHFMNKLFSTSLFACRLFEIFKIFIKFIGILLLCTLALFLPFINIFVYYLAFYYLFHKLLMLDITSSVLDKENFKIFNAQASTFEFKFSTLCFYLVSSIPLLGIFLQVFFVIFLTHLAYQRILKLEVKGWNIDFVIV